MNIIDTHSHLFLEEFKDDFPEVIERAKTIGVSQIYMPNIDCTTVDALFQSVSQYPNYCIPLIGLHPTSVGSNYEEELQKLRPLLDDSSVPIAGIGEVGLDLYWDKTYYKEQEKAFRLQIEWALDYNLPLVIHCREASAELYAIMCDYKTSDLRGIFHSFTGGTKEAEQLMEFEHFMFGVNGVVTFKKSTLPETLKVIPLERLVLETDSPYLAPVPCRGKRNESSYIRYTLSRVAELYEKSEEEVANLTTESALKVFKSGKMGT